MLNIGVIGCGGMGRDHIKRITERTQGAQVVAVADMVETLAQKGQALAGDGCKIYSDGKDLINDPNVEAVFIVSPGFAHKESLLEAIKAGKHLIQLGFMRRYDKGYRQVKAAIESGEYGEPLIVHCTHRNPVVPDSYTTRMAVDDTAVHEIDVIHWLVNDDFVSAQVSTTIDTDCFVRFQLGTAILQPALPTRSLSLSNPTGQ